MGHGNRFAIAIAVGLCAVGCGSHPGGGGGEPMRTDAGTIAVDGAELAYLVEGTGPTCLVLGSATYYPRLFSDALKQSLRLIYVDLRHFAPADGSVAAESITRDTYADDVEQIRQALDLDEICLIGHSIHGTMALDYARRYPAHVARVVVIGTPPVGLRAMSEANRTYWEAEASDERKARLERNWEARREEIAALSPADAFSATYVTNGPLYWADDTYDCTPLWRDVFINVEVSDRVFGPVYAEYDLAAGGEVAAPVLIVMGRHDYVVPHTLWDTERDKLPHHQYVLLDASGHTPQLEQPAEFDAALLAFLGLR